MYDPFMDTLSPEPGSLQVPLVPSRSATPVIPSSTNDVSVATLTTPIQASNPTSSTPSIPETEVQALFDPLGSLSSNAPEARQSILGIQPQKPTARLKRINRPPQIATLANPPAPTSLDPLQDLLRKANSNESKPIKRSNEGTLFKPTLPSRIVQPQVVTPTATVDHDTEFGAFVSVPASSDPLFSLNSPLPVASNLPSIQQSRSAPNPVTSTRHAFQQFTESAKLRNQQNEHRIMGEFARSESTDGEFLGWLDDLEKPPTPVEKEGEWEWAKQREKRLKTEEGPESPPATPTDGPPPQMKKPSARSHNETTTSQTSDPSGSNKARPDSTERSAEGTGGVGSYFPAALPRRLSSMLTTTAPSPAKMSPHIHITPENTKENAAADKEEQDLHGIFAIPEKSSIDQLSSSVPRPSRPIHSSTLPASTSREASGSPSSRRPIPGSFLTHSTPFASSVYVPPSGAPGFRGDRMWDSGGFSDIWEEENNPANAELKPRKRVMKLIGRKEETVGVLTRGLADSIRPSLPALARLCSTWTLLYSLDQHGISLHTFYNRSLPSSLSSNKVSGGRKGALLVIRDSNDGVFGAWIGEGIRLSLTGEGHYGGGDSFLWKTSDVIPDPVQEKEDDPFPTITPYSWTGKNDYIALCEPEFVSFGGGGDGLTGLYISSSLLDGSSARSITFGNDVLSAADESGETILGQTVPFEIIGLEVWGLVAT